MRAWYGSAMVSDEYEKWLTQHLVKFLLGNRDELS